MEPLFIQMVINMLDHGKIQIQFLGLLHHIVQYLYNMVGEDYINITVMVNIQVIGVKTILFLFLIKEEE